MGTQERLQNQSSWGVLLTRRKHKPTRVVAVAFADGRCTWAEEGLDVYTGGLQLTSILVAGIA